jgi:hypothetical protein
MGRPTYREKPQHPDKGQAALVRQIRKLPGVGVHGVIVSNRRVDLIVGWAGLNILLETKSKGGTLRPSQRELLEHWPGQYDVAKELDDVIRVMNRLRGGERR